MYADPQHRGPIDPPRVAGVYIDLVAPQLVRVGFGTSITRRHAAHARQSFPVCLLAWAAGTIDDEADTHRRLRPHIANEVPRSRSHYHLSAPVRDVIDGMRASLGLGAWDGTVPEVDATSPVQERDLIRLVGDITQATNIRLPTHEEGRFDPHRWLPREFAVRDTLASGVLAVYPWSKRGIVLIARDGLRTGVEVKTSLDGDLLREVLVRRTT